MFDNLHAYRTSQCSSVPTYTFKLAVHNIALYRLGGAQDDFTCSLLNFCQSQCYKDREEHTSRTFPSQSTVLSRLMVFMFPLDKCNSLLSVIIIRDNCFNGNPILSGRTDPVNALRCLNLSPFCAGSLAAPPHLDHVDRFRVRD